MVHASPYTVGYLPGVWLIYGRTILNLLGTTTSGGYGVSPGGKYSVSISKLYNNLFQNASHKTTLKSIFMEFSK